MKNGSGKSTLASLFTGLFRPEGGKVYLNGKDLAECDLASVRKTISFVEQDAYLFGGGIQENVALGKGGNASREEITAALSRASVASADPDKDVGDGGSALSGGQRQRVALARAFVHSSPVLILDEGTRALDKETAKSVIKGLLSDKDLTVIAIAHDLDPFREFDRFILIDSGKAASFESFQDLIDRHPAFARIPDWQALCGGSSAPSLPGQVTLIPSRDPPPPEDRSSPRRSRRLSSARTAATRSCRSPAGPAAPAVTSPQG